MGARSLTDVIAQTILAELQQRRPVIDSGTLSSVSVTVRLQEGPNPIRTVSYEDQRMVWRRGGRSKPEQGNA